MPWELNGNAIATTGAFLGTTDVQPLIVKTTQTPNATPLERLRVTTEGRVGIGIINPSARLTVAGGGAIINNVAIGTNGLSVDYPDEQETLGLATPGTSAVLRLQSPNGLTFHTGTPGSTAADNLRMTITASGEVGVGKAPAANYTLDVAGTVNASDYHKGGVPLVASQWADVSGGISYAAGNVGVGKAPAANYTLDVAGTLNATDLHKNGAPLSVSQWDDVAGGITYGGGGVGIGKAPSTSHKLDVAGAINATGIRKNGSPVVSSQWTDISGGIGYDPPVVQGRVGIGTTDPSNKLHVVVEPGSLLGIRLDNGGEPTLNMFIDETASEEFFHLESIGADLHINGSGEPVHIQNLIGRQIRLGGDDLSLTMMLRSVPEKVFALETRGADLQLNGGSPVHIQNLIGRQIRLDNGGERSLAVAGGDITWGNNSRLQTDQGGSIELGADRNTVGTGSPYIDFHFQGLTQDFNTRIQNDANGQLTISAGTLRATGNAIKPGGGSWGVGSDIRLKKNVEPLKGALGKLLGLRGILFEWKEPEKQGNLVGPQLGLVAQEVEEVFPEWVDTDPSGYKILTVRGFEALAVEAFRELKTKNETLKLKNEELEDRIKILESTIPERQPSGNRNGAVR